MADNVIDTLSIQINATSQSASNQIDELAGKLERLSGALGKLSGSSVNFSGLESGISNLNSAVSQLDAGRTEAVSQALKGLSSSISSLSRAVSGMSGDALTGIASGLRGLSSASTGITSLDSLGTLAANVAKLGYKNVNAGIANMANLADGLVLLGGSRVPDLGNVKGLADLASGMSKLGGKNASVALSNIQPLITGLKMLSQLSGIEFPDATGLTEFTSALSALGRKGVTEAIANIPQLTSAFMEMLQTLSTAPEVSTNVIKIAQAMADLAKNMKSATTATNGFNSKVKSLSAFMTNIGRQTMNTSKRILSFGKNMIVSAKTALTTSISYQKLASKIGLLYAQYWMVMRVIRMFGGMVNTASALTEVQNVVDTTFGNMSKKLEDFSKTSIKGFGLSELSAKQFASQFQAMGVNMGITANQVKQAQSLLNNKRTAMGAVAGYNKMSDSMADMSINLTKLTA